MTTHKSQGLTLKSILVDLSMMFWLFFYIKILYYLILIFISGLDLFKAGMAYVVLSRAKQLKHVYIIDFDVSVWNVMANVY